MQKIIFLTVLRKAGVEVKRVYLAIIRPILEYAVPVWQAIPEYLSQKIESVQKRAPKIIKPGEESYEELLRLFNVEKFSQGMKNYVDNIWVKSKAQITN